MTVQGPVKEQQPDGMSHRGGGGAGSSSAPGGRQGHEAVRQLLQPPPLPRFAHARSTATVERWSRCLRLCTSHSAIVVRHRSSP